MYRLLFIGALVVIVLGTYGAVSAEESPVYMANGVKIGEVTQHSAIVWTRLTKSPDRTTGIPFVSLGKDRWHGARNTTQELTGGHPLEKMEGAVPGAAGLVRVTYWPKQDVEAKTQTDWMPVDVEADFTHQFKLEGLLANTPYLLRLEAKPTAEADISCMREGRFRTAPKVEQAVPVNFVVVTCQEYPRRDDPQMGHKIYNSMLNLDPDFFVHTGDIEYYDKPLPYAPNRELARFKWNRLYAMPYQRTFHLNVASYFIKDDHDTLKNDCWSGQRYGELTWEQGLAIFREQVPMGEKTYRTIRWGKDVQIWLVEGRDYRSPNTMKDGPEKSIWGKEQKAWFKRTVQASDATFRVLISPTPVVGPDRDRKNDNHANKGFATEGKELRKFMAAQKNMVVINGDRHWQYVSVDDETGLQEFGTGPASDIHAGGWKQDDFRPEHRYLKLKGGFLHVTVTRESGTPEMRMQHCGVDGALYNKVVIRPN